MPLTKAPDSSVEYALASSTASSMTTAVGGPSGSINSATARRRTQAVDHGHALDGPVGRGGADTAVGLVARRRDVLEQGADVGVGRHGQGVGHGHGVLPLELGLVEEGERPFALLVAGGVVRHTGR